MGRSEGNFQANMLCVDCHGLGYIFVCDRWNLTGGLCCPDGTTLQGCSGKRTACSCVVHAEEQGIVERHIPTLLRLITRTSKPL